MFNLGAGEIVLLAGLALGFLGEEKLADIAESVRRWAWSDWVLVLAAFASGALAFALLTATRP